MLVFLGLAIGDPEAPAHAARAHELALAVGDARLLHEANDAIADVLEVRRSVEEARALLEREYEYWHERDELLAADALFGLAHVELWGDRWELAAEYADRAYELVRPVRARGAVDPLPIAMIAAHRGQLEDARTHSERALQLGEEQFGRHTPVHLGTLGVVALQAGDPHAAVEWFDEAEATTTRLGWGEAGKRWWVPDHVEALLALERPDEAERVLDVWEADARRLERGWVLAHVTRCRGLVAAARGDVSERSFAPRGRRRRSTRRSTMPSGGPERCSRSASSGGGSGRSAPPATRSARRSPGSSGSARRPGSRRRAPSSAGSAAEPASRA